MIITAQKRIMQQASKTAHDWMQEAAACLALIRLVAKHLGVDEVAEIIFQWWKTSSDLDTQGPFAVAKDLGCACVFLSFQLDRIFFAF